MTDKQLLEMALEVLESATPKYTRQRKDQKTLGGALDYWRLEQHQRLKAITAIRARLEQPEERYTYGTPLLDAFTKPAPVQEPVATDDLPKGFIPLQQVNGQLVYAACMDFNARHYKWLMRKHPAGHWVSERKLEDWEVMQVEDQDHYGIIQEAETTPPAAPVQKGN